MESAHIDCEYGLFVLMVHFVDCEILAMHAGADGFVCGVLVQN